MDDTNKSLLLDINFRTELLESLDWDESQFDSLFIFLQENFQSNKVGPKELLEQIKVKYGENTSKLYKKSDAWTIPPLDVTDAVNACSSLDVHPNAALSVASLLSKLEITALNAFIAFASFVLCSTVGILAKTA